MKLNNYDEFINEGLKETFNKIIDKFIKKFGKSFTTEKTYKDYMKEIQENDEQISEISKKIKIEKSWVEENKDKKNYNTLLGNKIKDMLSEKDYETFIKLFK